jgi:hypothetical protein
MAKTVFEELYNLAYAWIEFMNSEDVIAYDEKQLAAYRAGIEETPYDDIATGMETEAIMGGESSQRTRDILGGFLGTGEAINNEIVKNVITAVIGDFLNTGSQAVAASTKKGDSLHCNDVPYQAGKNFLVTGSDSKGNFVLLDLDVLAERGEENLDFTSFWRVSPKYLEQHFSTL